MKDLTAQQSRVLAFLRGFIAEHGFPPTYKDIRAEFGWASNNAVSNMLARLQAKGAIRVDSMVSRGIAIVPAHAGPGVSARGHRFVFIAPVRAYRGGPVLFPPTPVVYTPGGAT